MDKSLETLLKDRIKQAKKKKISEKAESIAVYLGKQAHQSLWDLEKGPSLVYRMFENKDFQITYHAFVVLGCGEQYRAEIRHNKNVVFSERSYYGIFFKHMIIDSYVPGDWEYKFNFLYDKAQEAGKLTNKLEKQDETELKKRFGL